MRVESIVILEQPDDKLLGFVACKASNAECIFINVFKFFRDKNISLNEICAIGCDGASVSIRTKKGIIYRLENQRVSQ